ncbi:MAG: ATP-binding protein [Candidatus Symbiobacter sp.]|nr:ATP-binding protein [Candidatus Symbiobacter sp.]
MKAPFSLTMENLGPIRAKGTIAPKKLTIFTGPNNGGKTYAMYALWGLGQFHPSDIEFKLPDYCVDEIISKGQTVLKFDEYFVKMLEEIQSSFSKRMVNIYNKIIAHNISVKSMPKFNLQLNLEEIKKNKPSEGIKISSLDFRFPMFSIDTPISVIDNNKKGMPQVDLDKRNLISRWTRLHVIESLYNLYHINGFFIPAERSGVALSYIDMGQIRSRLFDADYKPDYPLPIAEYANFLLRQPKRFERALVIKSINELGMEFIEDKIAHGHYDVGEKQGARFIPDGMNEGNSIGLPLHAASSTVKSLYGLWLYLATEPTKKRTIMIDEPELNLHIHNQILVARLLARLVNDGHHVIFSTHSDNIIREISSLIILGSNKDKDLANERKEIMARHKIDEAECLNIEDVVVYNFPNDGTPIEECPITKTGGIKVLEMNKAIEEMQQELHESAAMAFGKED